MPRLFHTLVVYGAGVTLYGCGGRATDSTGGSHGGSAGAGDAGLASGGNGAAPSGGEGGMATGGGGVAEAGAGGAGGSSPGGRPATGGEGGAGGDSAAWTTAQWDCDAEISFCNGGAVLEAACDVDPSRPRSASDCAPGEWLECHRAELDGRELIVNCACVPASDPGTCDVCAEAITPYDAAQADTCDGPVVLCTCYTVILR